MQNFLAFTCFVSLEEAGNVALRLRGSLAAAPTTAITAHSIATIRGMAIICSDKRMKYRNV